MNQVPQFGHSGNDGFENALKSAILYPAANMKIIEDFEASFDAVWHHLGIALGKAESEQEVALIQRVAQELFSFYVQLVARMIEVARKGNVEEFIKNIKSTASIADLVEEMEFEKIMQTLALDILVNFVTGFVRMLFQRMELAKSKTKFYIQVAKSYRKVVPSMIYTPKYKLMNNAIERQRADLINAIIDSREWDEGVNFLATLKSIESLASNNKYEFISSANMESDFIKGYRQYRILSVGLIKRIFSVFSITILLFLVLLVLVILLAFNNDSGAATLIVIVAMVADIWFIRYFLGFGPEVSELRRRIKKRTEEITRDIIRIWNEAKRQF